MRLLLAASSPEHALSSPEPAHGSQLTQSQACPDRLCGPSDAPWCTCQVPKARHRRRPSKTLQNGGFTCPRPSMRTAEPNMSRVPPFLCFLSFFPAGGVHKVCKLHLTRRAFTVSAKTEAFLHVTAEECSEPHSQLRHPTYELAGVVQLVETCTQAHCFGIRCGHSLASIAIKLLGSTTRTFTSLLRPAACGGSGQVRPLRPG